MTAKHALHGVTVLALALATSNAAQGQDVTGERLVDVLRNYEILARKVTPTSKVETEVVSNPQAFVDGTELRHLGVLSDGTFSTAVQTDDGSVIGFEDAQGVITLYKGGQRLDYLPPISRNRPNAFVSFDPNDWPDRDVSADELGGAFARAVLRAWPKGETADVMPILWSGLPEQRIISDRAEAESYLHQVYAVPDDAIYTSPDDLYLRNTGMPSDEPTIVFLPPPEIGAAPEGGATTVNPGDPYTRAEDLPPNVVDLGMEGESGDPLDMGFVECRERVGVQGEEQGGVAPCALGVVAVHWVDDIHRVPNCSGIVISPRHVLTAAHCGLPQGEPEKDIWLSERFVGLPKGEDEIVVDKPPQGLGRMKMVARFQTVPDAEDPLAPKDSGQQEFFETPDLMIYRLVPAATPFHTIRVPRIYSGDLQGLSAAEMLAVGYGTNPTASFTGRKQAVTLGGSFVACGDVQSCDPNFEFVNATPEVLLASAFFGTGEETMSDFGSGSFEGLLSHYPPDTCKGDSGGPVFAKIGDRWSLAAITSRALERAIDNEKGCSLTGGIYVGLGFDPILAWIDEILDADGCVKESGSDWVRYRVCGG